MSTTSNISRRRQLAQLDGGSDYAARRAEIIRIAATLFKEKGFKATRLADIALAAGLDRATIYYYAGSKEELFREAVENVLTANLAFAEALITNEALRPVERLELFAEKLMNSYSENYPYPYVYIQEQMHQVASDTMGWAQEIGRKTHLLEGMVMRMLREAVAQGQLRADIPIRLVANAFFGMFNWTHRWYEPGIALGASDVARGFMAIFLDGMKSAHPTNE